MISVISLIFLVRPKAGLFCFVGFFSYIVWKREALK